MLIRLPQIADLNEKVRVLDNPAMDVKNGSNLSKWFYSVDIFFQKVDMPVSLPSLKVGSIRAHQLWFPLSSLFIWVTVIKMWDKYIAKFNVKIITYNIYIGCSQLFHYDGKSTARPQKSWNFGTRLSFAW